MSLLSGRPNPGSDYWQLLSTSVSRLSIWPHNGFWRFSNANMAYASGRKKFQKDFWWILPWRAWFLVSLFWVFFTPIPPPSPLTPWTQTILYTVMTTGQGNWAPPTSCHLGSVDLAQGALTGSLGRCSGLLLCGKIKKRCQLLSISCRSSSC